MYQDEKLQEQVKKAGTFFLILIWLLFLMSLGLSQWHDTLGVALAVGLPTAALPTVLIVMAPQALFTRLVVAAALMAGVRNANRTDHEEANV
jgi:methyl-accepting chemotaxis protein